uniref:Nitroreductase domain-containing protein n=1 Tax=Faecalibaculum rodentium TaxID=1702221 RepID=A0A140DRK4_9FIRM|nr:hypothetical protein AALO17_01470 [Faecalibaculum rodentium]
MYDLGSFGYGLMLSARNLGIGFMPAYELVKYLDLLAEDLGIDEEYVIAMGVALGYSADTNLDQFHSCRRRHPWKPDRLPRVRYADLI